MNYIVGLGSEGISWDKNKGLTSWKKVYFDINKPTTENYPQRKISSKSKSRFLVLHVSKGYNGVLKGVVSR